MTHNQYDKLDDTCSELAGTYILMIAEEGGSVVTVHHDCSNIIQCGKGLNVIQDTRHIFPHKTLCTKHRLEQGGAQGGLLCRPSPALGVPLPVLLGESLLGALGVEPP